MQNNILYVELTLLCASILVCAIYVRRRRGPEMKYPRVAHPLDCYDADFTQLAFYIHKAESLYHLGLIRKEITQFKDKYVAYKEPVQLMIDTNKLRRMYKDHRVRIDVIKKISA